MIGLGLGDRDHPPFRPPRLAHLRGPEPLVSPHGIDGRGEVRSHRREPTSHLATVRAAALAILFVAGCHASKPAMLFQADGAKVKISVPARTGDGPETMSDVDLPSGTRVTILGD